MSSHHPNNNSHIETNYIKQLLENVNSEAMSLLDVSRKRKEKYTKEISELKQDNIKLREILECIKCSQKNNEKEMTMRQSDNSLYGNRTTMREIEEQKELGKTSAYERQERKTIMEEFDVVKKQLGRIGIENEQLKCALATAKTNLHDVNILLIITVFQLH